MAAKTGTYTLIDSVTVANTSTVSIAFSSIPQTYTDLVLVTSSSGTTGDPFLRINGDTGDNYSDTWFEGRASGPTTGRYANRSFHYFGYEGTARNSVQMVSTFNLMNYANTATYKTSIWRYADVNYSVEEHVGLWRNTAAITSLNFGVTAGNFVVGSTFKLYGIEAGNQ